jgi:ankyrin repeat protein
MITHNTEQSNTEIQKLKELILKGKLDMKINCDEISTSPIFLAIKNLDLKLIKSLLEYDFDPNFPDTYGESPLMKIVNEIMNYCSKEKETTLIEMAKELIDYGADINRKDESGYTALSRICNWGFLQRSDATKALRLVNLLLDNGAEISTPSFSTFTLLNNVLKVFEHDARVFSAILEYVEDINCMEHGKTLLMDLIYYKEAIEVLVKRPDIDLEIMDASGDTALLQAVSLKHGTETVRFLLDAGANVNVSNYSGYTPLHFAKNADTVSLLIKHGAKPNVQNENGDTPLHLYGMNTDCLRALSLCSPDPNITNSLYGCAPLHNLFRNYYYHLQHNRKNFADELINCVNIYLSMGVDINVQDEKGYTILHYLCSSDLRSENKLKVAEHLLLKGADLKISNPNGKTPIDIISTQDEPLLMKLFMDKPNDENTHTTSEEIDKAFFNACKNGQRGVAEILLKNNEVDFHYTDDEGNTALHYAAYWGYANMCNILINGDSNINYTNRNGKTPLHYACEKRYKVIIKKLIENGADCTITDNDGILPLHYAASNGQNDVINLLIENGADIDFQDRNGNTPFLLAASKRKLQTLKLLIDEGADIELSNNKEETPLILAASIANKPLCSLLLDNGADPNHNDALGNTALHYAAKRGAKELINQLISDGAEINLINNNGHTPLHIACYYGKLQSVKELLKYGADQNRTDNHSQKPIDIASEEGYKEIVEYLTILSN